MASVIIYTTNSCPYCKAAKNLLHSKGIPYQEINVEEDQTKRKWLTQVTGQRTVPQIFINDKSIGGFQELSELDQEGKLDGMLG